MKIPVNSRFFSHRQRSRGSVQGQTRREYHVSAVLAPLDQLDPPALHAGVSRPQARGEICVLTSSGRPGPRGEHAAGRPTGRALSDGPCYLHCDVHRRLPLRRQQRERLSSGTLQRALVEHPLAGGADLPLDLVRDPRALAESVLDDRSVPVTPILPVHLHLRVVTTSTRTS
jgi:hypothetical protein